MGPPPTPEEVAEFMKKIKDARMNREKLSYEEVAEKMSRIMDEYYKTPMVLTDYWDEAQTATNDAYDRALESGAF